MASMTCEEGTCTTRLRGLKVIVRGESGGVTFLQIPVVILCRRRRVWDGHHVLHFANLLRDNTAPPNGERRERASFGDGWKDGVLGQVGELSIMFTRGAADRPDKMQATKMMRLELAEMIKDPSRGRFG
ncbi:hypothetical protein Bbelb_375440 [Branchiostoma belcheri]|nr:hypothetical protein Bbelb_375440 [Branchiostoma belcheri]